MSNAEYERAKERDNDFILALVSGLEDGNQDEVRLILDPANRVTVRPLNGVKLVALTEAPPVLIPGETQWNDLTSYCYRMPSLLPTADVVPREPTGPRRVDATFAFTGLVPSHRAQTFGPRRPRTLVAARHCLRQRRSAPENHNRHGGNLRAGKRRGDRARRLIDVTE